MKKIIILITIISLIVLLPLSAEDTEKKKDENIEAKLSFGIVAVGKSDSMVKTKEYYPVDDGVRPFLKTSLQGNINKMFFNLISKFNGDITDQSHVLNFDFNRILKQEISFDSLHHRLDHDPLINIDVISEARSAAYAEDLNPNDQYYLNRSEFVSKTQLSLPMVPGVKFYVHYRDEHRNGMYQARTLSKCSACHVVAKSRSINSYNRDVEIGTNVRIGKSNIDYSYTVNQFRERVAAPQNFFLETKHPENMKKVFTSRIGVGDNEYLPFDVVPESKKGTHLLKAAVPLANNKVISARYTGSTVENVNSNLQWKSNAFAGAFTARIGKKAFFNTIMTYQKIDNDSVFININERVDDGGPYIGSTYPEVFDYLDTFNWTRNSALSRTVINLKTNFRYKFSKNFKLRLGYDYENIDREYFEVMSTGKNTFKVKLIMKPADKFKVSLDGKYSTLTDPFANLKGGIVPGVQLYALPSPLAPTAVQFYTWHIAREGTMTNYPEKISELRGRFHWGPSSKFSLNANLLYKAEDNDNLITTGASWNRELFQWGTDLWVLLSKKLSFSATYYNYSNTYRTMFAIAALEGCGGAIIGGMTGTVTDMMDLDIRTETLLLNLSYWASKKLTLYANFSYNDSSSNTKNLSLDDSQVPYLPGSTATALDFENYGDIAEYSDLDMKQMIAQLGINVMLSGSWWLNGSFYYYLYDDYAQYLYTDTTGKSYSFYLGVTWKK